MKELIGHLKNKRGSALLIVIIVMFLLSVLGTAILYLGASDQRLVEKQEDELNAYYVARSAADAMAAHLYQSIDSEDDRASVAAMLSTISPASSPDNISIGPSEFHYTVTTQFLNASELHLLLTSTASAVSGTASETVKLKLRYSKGIFDHAIFTNGSVELSLDTGNNTTINGNVGTNGTDDIRVDNGTVINGDLFYGPDGDPLNVDNSGTINGGTLELDAPLPFYPIDETQFPDDAYSELPTDLIITENHHYDDIVLSGGDLLTFDDTNSYYYLRTDRLTVGGNAEIIVPEGVDVHLYVTDTLDLGGTAFMTGSSGGHLYIYYSGTDNVTLGGTPSFAGMIYAPNACVNYSGGGSGQAYICGSIIAESYLGSSSNNVIITYDETLDLAHLSIVNYAPMYIKELWFE